MFPHCPKIPLLCTALLLAMGACDNSSGPPVQPGPSPSAPTVLVFNESPLDLQRVRLSGPGDSVEYGAIPSGTFTMPVPWNDKVSFIEVETSDGSMFTLLTDTTIHGERPDPGVPGSYGYVLNFDNPTSPTRLELGVTID